MVGNIEFFINKIKPKGIFDFLSLGLLLFYKNFDIILKKIFIPQIFIIILIRLILDIFSFEFNLSYFISSDGILLLAISFIALNFGQSLGIYQIQKILLKNNLGINIASDFLKIFLSNLVRIILLILTIAAYIVNEHFLLILLTLVLVHIVFHYLIFYLGVKSIDFEFQNSFMKNIINIARFIGVYFASIFVKFVIPLLLTGGFILVYESLRVLISGEFFFTMLERKSYFQFLFSLFIGSYFVISLITNFTLITFLKNQSSIYEGHFIKLLINPKE